MKGKAKAIKYKRSFLSIEDAIIACERYNKKHKSSYTYGQFINLLESGKIRIYRK